MHTHKIIVNPTAGRGAGERAVAERCCRQILEMDPGNEAAADTLATMETSGGAGGI